MAADQCVDPDFGEMLTWQPRCMASRFAPRGGEPYTYHLFPSFVPPLAGLLKTHLRKAFEEHQKVKINKRKKQIGRARANIAIYRAYEASNLDECEKCVSSMWLAVVNVLGRLNRPKVNAAFGII